MEFLADLFQQDMFFAVASYLSFGLVILLYFFYREKKWERDLIQYQVQDKLPSLPSFNDVFGNAIETCGLHKIVAAAPPIEEEMQVIEGETIDLEPEPLLTGINPAAIVSPR